MKRRVLLAVNFLLLVVVLSPLPVSAGDEGRPVKGVTGPAQGVIPSQARPTPASARALATEDESARAEENAPPPSSEHSKAETQRRKSLGEQPTLKTGGKEIHVDSTPTPLAPNVGTNFGGLGQNGWIPYDAAIAVGPNHVVAMSNSQWIVYDRAGATVRAVTGFATWWGTAAGTPFDPKCFYDPVGGRFVMLAVSQTTTGGNKAFYHLSISQTGDPTGSWYNYQFDATKDGTTSTSNWADFPGLGYDDNAVYITSNQFTFSGGVFQYAKIRVLSKTQLYGGSAATFTDFVGAALRNSDSSQAFTVQPARTLSSTASEYFLNTNSNSNNTVTLWRVDGAPASPTLVRQTTFAIGVFSAPPDAVQNGTATRVATNDDRMYDFVWRSGIIHASFGEAFSSLAAVRYLRLDSTNNTVLKDVTYTQPGVHYYYPAVTDDSAGNLYMIFSRSSSSEYPSVYQTGMTPADSAIEPSARVKAGVAPNTSGRWGDYSAIVNDPADNLAVVSYAGWGNTSNRWATWITGMAFAGGTPTPTLVSVSPSSGTQGANINVALSGLNTHWVQGTSVIGISGSGVSASVVNVTSANTMTATFNISASAATGTRNVTVTTGAEVTTSAPFTVNVVGAPTLTAISPTRGYVGLAATHTLTGTNFVSGMTVNVSGTLVTPSNVIVTSSTQATVVLTVALNATLGGRNISVTTASGTSGTRLWRVVGLPVISSMSPTSGGPGTTVAVTLLGAEFVGSNLVISGNGVTQSNFQILSDDTKITANFIIAANAAAGGRNVTVVNGAGTSNVMVFTVNGGTNPPTLASVTPSSGDPGTSVNVTLAGTNFTTTSTVNVGGGDVAVSNVNVLTNASLTATFAIAANAGGGGRNVTVTTPNGTSGAQTFTVNNTGPAITTASLPNGTVGIAYDQSLVASGGTQPYLWAIAVGSLPSGLNLDPNTGAITGTPGVAGAGTTNFTAQVTDANSQTATKSLSITVNSNQPVIGAASLANGQVGFLYNVDLNVSGGVVPYTIGVVVGALPNGLNLDPSTGVITGTPGVAAAGISTFTVQVSDSFGQTAQKQLSITIAANQPSITSTPSPNGQVGIPYCCWGIAVSGGVPPYTFSIVTGMLPSGLSLDPTSGNGRIFGTPTLAAVGTSTFTAQVTDGLGQTAQKQLSITIVSNQPTVITPSPLYGQVGIPFNLNLSESGGIGPFTWAIIAGALPTNLSLDPNTAAITGTPNTQGTFNFTAQVTDALGQTAAKALSIAVNPAVSVATTSLPGGQVGVSFSATVVGAGGTLPYSWGITAGALPAGLGLNASTGAISGSPSTAGTFNFTVTVTDALGQTAAKALSIAVNPAVSVATTALPGGQVGVSYNATVVGAGGTLPYSWSITVGALPAGLGLNASTGLISGTPSAAGSFNFTVTATDALGQTAAKALSITISSLSVPTLGALNPVNMKQGTSVTVSFTGSNLVPGATTMSINTPGVTITNVNITSSTAGTATFTAAANAAVGRWQVKVTTAGGTSNSTTFGVYGLPSLTSISPTSGTRGTNVSVTFDGSNFFLTDLRFSCSGILTSNFLHTVPYTQFKLTFVIASGAPVGPCAVTVSNAAGVSNAATFTVN